MYQSNWSFNMPPPWATPQAFELLKIGLFKFPPLGAKKPFKCPTNWYWNTSVQRQILSAIKHCSHFSERDMSRDTFTFLLKTLLKELFTNKGKSLSCKSVNSAKTEKTHGILHHLSKATFKFPPPQAWYTVNCLGHAGGEGGDVEASIWPVCKWQ